MESTQFKTLVLIDDEPDIRLMVEMALSFVDQLTIHPFGSGEQALREMAELRPDLVLMDVMMPAMDGPAVLRQMRGNAALAGIPVIFMTAKSTAQEHAKLRGIGAAGVVTKPFDPIQLQKQLLGLWDGIDGLADRRAAMRLQMYDLGGKFLQRCSLDMLSIRDMIARLRSGDRSAFRGLEQLVHRITGTGASLGLDSLSECAARIEQLVAKQTEFTAPTAATIDRLEQYIAALARQIALCIEVRARDV